MFFRMMENISKKMAKTQAILLKYLLDLEWRNDYFLPE